MKIAIGADHAGFELKQEFIKTLKGFGHEVIDFGTNSLDSVDYPDFAEQVASKVSSKEADRGILICGTGIGMAMTANKFSDVRAAVCNDLYSAKMSRLHNDANVLAIGGRMVGKDLAKEILIMWLSTEYEGGRHQRRLDKIKRCEETNRHNGA